LKDVAKTAGVSTASVSHVLNRTRFVSEDVTQRIEQAIRVLNFKPNPVARNLRGGKSGLVGFIISNSENHFYMNIARGIEKVISAHGYRLLIMDSAERKANEMDNVESLYLRGIDGLIIVPSSPDFEYLKTMVYPKYPIVFADRQPSNYEADTVLLANFEAAYAATRHLISKGYREIGFLAFHFGVTEIDKSMQERIDGFTAALKDNGISFNPQVVKAVAGGVPATVNELMHTQSYNMMDQLLKTPVRAVLCGNSLAAVGAYTCLKDRKLRIPEDISLITFDDDVWIHLVSPRISAVVQPAESLGILAAQRLISRLEEKKLPCECFRLEAQLVLRES
jgi:LacI family transcriptional regulator